GGGPVSCALLMWLRCLTVRAGRGGRAGMRRSSIRATTRLVLTVVVTIGVSATGASGAAPEGRDTQSASNPLPARTDLQFNIASQVTRPEVNGLVEIGRGRKLFVECQGSGSPTVVLISGKGTDASDWMQIADPTDPAVHTPTDDVGAGLARQIPSNDAVFPAVARFTRVCAYDRPDTRLTGYDLSTPRSQPHTVNQDVRDLHALLRAIGEPTPYVLVPHSYGGWIAELYARRYPKSVGGLVMVDAATELLKGVMSPTQLTNW